MGFDHVIKLLQELRERIIILSKKVDEVLKEREGS